MKRWPVNHSQKGIAIWTSSLQFLLIGGSKFSILQIILSCKFQGLLDFVCLPQQISLERQGFEGRHSFVHPFSRFQFILFSARRPSLRHLVSMRGHSSALFPPLVDLQEMSQADQFPPDEPRHFGPENQSRGRSTRNGSTGLIILSPGFASFGRVCGNDRI